MLLLLQHAFDGMLGCHAIFSVQSCGEVMAWRPKCRARGKGRWHWMDDMNMDGWMDSNFFLHPIGFSMFFFILWIRGCQFHWITSGFSFHFIHPFRNHINESMSISPDWERRWEDNRYTLAAYVSIMPNVCHRYPWQKRYPTFHRASTTSSMVQLVGVLS